MTTEPWSVPATLPTPDPPTRGAAPSTRPTGLPPWASGALGLVGVVLVWWLLAATVFADVGPSGVQAVPTPPQVLGGFVESGAAPYLRNLPVTLAEAGLGYVWGNGLALLLSALVLVVPRLEAVVTQVAVISYCIPVVAIGLLVVVIAPLPQPGQPSVTAVFLAALSCFFTTVVGALLGLKAADRASLDVVSVYGGSRLTQLRKVRLVAALPAVLNALQVAVPAAFLGAVLGEFFGKVTVGVGPSMIAAQQQLDAVRVWDLALVSGAVALLGYGLVGLVARAVAPWAKGAAS